MKLTSAHFYLIFLYVITALYFLVIDLSAAFVFVALSSIVGMLSFISFKFEYIVLTLFSFFFFLANAVSPSFFIINKNTYSFSGWTAVKNFNFSAPEFFQVYVWVFLTIFLIYFFFFGLSAVFGSSKNKADEAKTAFYFGSFLKNFASEESKGFYGILLSAFIFLIAIPLTLAMGYLGVGIVGMEQVRLPFKLTGILYYSRYMIVPILIFFLYYKSKRSWMMDLFICSYALVAGLSSVSRSILVMAFMPILLLGFVEKKYFRLTYLMFLLFAFYHMTGIARNYVYIYQPINYIGLVEGLKWDFMFDIFGQIGARLGGTQDHVLALQHTVGDRTQAIINFFTLHPVTPNDAYEIYGFNLPADKAFGVGLSLVSWLLIIAGNNIGYLFLLCFTIALLLFIAECAVKRIISVNQHSALFAYPLSFILVFLLYTSQIKFFYIFLFFAVFSSYVLMFFKKITWKIKVLE